MKRLFSLLLIPIVCSSCIEKIDTIEKNFEKIYGFTGNSWPTGISQIADKTFIIHGWAERTVMDSKDIIKDAQMPVIIKIDHHANEIMTRTYPVGNIEYKYNPAGKSSGFTFAQFHDVKELRNGKYLAIVSGNEPQNSLEFEGILLSDGYMLLDENLNVEKFELFDDSEPEFESTFLVDRSYHKIFTRPDEDDLFVLATQSYYLDSAFKQIWQTGFYSIYRISLDGHIKDVYDYDMDAEPLTATDMVFDNDGNAIVVGKVNFSPDWGYKAFIHKIDLETGDILNQVEINNRPYLTNLPKIVATEGGFVLAEIEGAVWPPVLSTSLLDQEFNTIDVNFYPAREHEECFLTSFIPMQNGGFSAYSSTCVGPISIYRLDSDRNEMWRWESIADNSDGYIGGSLIETSDGGLLLLRSKHFNASSFKISVLKIDANGNNY